MAGKQAMTISAIKMPTLLRKLDPEGTIQPAIGHILKAAGKVAETESHSGAAKVSSRMAAKIGGLQLSETAARVTAPSFPVRFSEFGTLQYPPGMKRVHRKRETKAALKAGARWHIKPRKFLSRARSKARVELTSQIQQARLLIEMTWSAD